MQCLCIIYILRFRMGILLLLFLFPLSMSPFSSFPSAPLLLPSFPSRSLNHKISTEQSQKNRMNCHEKRPSFVTVQGVFLAFHLRMGDSKIQGFSNDTPQNRGFSNEGPQNSNIFDSGMPILKGFSNQRPPKCDDFQVWDC